MYSIDVDKTSDLSVVQEVGGKLIDAKRHMRGRKDSSLRGAVVKADLHTTQPPATSRHGEFTRLKREDTMRGTT
jgi:hypothetical protein